MDLIPSLPHCPYPLQLPLFITNSTDKETLDLIHQVCDRLAVKLTRKVEYISKKPYWLATTIGVIVRIDLYRASKCVVIELRRWGRYSSLLEAKLIQNIIFNINAIRDNIDKDRLMPFKRSGEDNIMSIDAFDSDSNDTYASLLSDTDD